MKIIAFFNPTGGVGKTTLAYHLAWVFADWGVRTLAFDLDPQSSLSSLLLSEERMSYFWDRGLGTANLGSALRSLVADGPGEVRTPPLETIAQNLSLAPGDLSAMRLEESLSEAWTGCLAGSPRAFTITRAVAAAIQLAAGEVGADLVLLDLGPGAGSMNRCGWIAADYIVVPLLPDPLVFPTLRNLGLVLGEWGSGWAARLAGASPQVQEPPHDVGKPAGYLMQRLSTHQSHPSRRLLQFPDRIPTGFRAAMGLPPAPPGTDIASDPLCLAHIANYPSLMPMAVEARKPIFHLKPADGAIGAHVAAVAECGKDFRLLARRLATAVSLDLPKLAGA